MTPEQLETMQRVRADLIDELSSVDREAAEAESAARHYYFAVGPRISAGEHPHDPVRDLALQAQWSAGAYDAARIVAAEALERNDHLPPDMEDFVAKVLRGAVSRPAKPNTRVNTDLRNKILAYAIWRLQLAGIKPTKAVESNIISGCDIVADIYMELLADVTNYNVPRPKGGKFSRREMHKIWLTNTEIKEWRAWMERLPRATEPM